MTLGPVDNPTLFDVPPPPPQPKAWGDRQCRHCGNTYQRPGGGGTAYCAACVLADIYWRNQPQYQRVPTDCAYCGTTYKRKQSARFPLCPTCTRHPVFDRFKASLGRHNAPIAFVVALMDWPYCANEDCGAWLPEEITTDVPGKWGTKQRANCTIDHDHGCCKGEASCGRCIRGALCRRCNNMLTTDNPDHMRGLARYLERWAT